MANLIRPKDYRKKTCSPISSECVVWDGPDIPCLDLCHGDSVEKVVYDLAIEVCNILKSLSLEGIDVSCFFNTECKPKTFEEFLQFIVDSLCDIKNQIGSISSFSCERLNDCTISFTDCNGDNQTFPLLSSTGPNIFTYILGRICDLYGEINNIYTEINTINTTLINLQNQITLISSGSSIFPLAVSNCIHNGNINNQSELATYLDALGDRIQTIFTALTGGCNNSFNIPDTTWFCDDRYFSINTTFSNLNQLISSLQTLVTNLCTAFTNIGLAINDIQVDITNIQTNLSQCGCNCPKNVGLVVNWYPYYYQDVYYYTYININVIPPSTGGWVVPANGISITSAQLIDGNSNVISSNVINTNDNSQINITSLFNLLNLDGFGCIRSYTLTNGRLVYSRNPFLYLLLTITLQSGSQTCTIYKEAQLPAEWCLCGYVENAEFIEYDTNRRLNPTLF